MISIDELLQVLKDLTQALNRFAAVFESGADPLVASTEPEQTAAPLPPEPVDAAPSKPKRVRDRKKQPEPAPVPAAPPPHDPEAEMIARHIAEKGVTRCPPAAVGDTTASIPEDAKEAIRLHEEARLAKLRDEMSKASQGRRNTLMRKF